MHIQFKEISTELRSTTIDNLRLLQEFLVEVIDESLLVGSYLQPETNQVQRRIACRSLFSAFEAHSSILKQSAVVMDQLREESVFNEIEMLALRDLEYTVDQSGSVKKKKARIRFKDNIKLAFASAAKAHGFDHGIDWGAQEWQDFSRALEIRDRITHPKKVDDLTIKDADLDLIKAAYDCFRRNVKLIAGKMSYPNTIFEHE